MTALLEIQSDQPPAAKAAIVGEGGMSHQITGEPIGAEHEKVTLSCSPGSLRIIYRVTAIAGSQNVITLDSGFELPHATEPEFIPLTDSSCSKLFELLVATPLQTGIRAFLQRRFDELRTQQKAAGQPNDSRPTAPDDAEARTAVLKAMHRAPEDYSPTTPGEL